MSEVDNVELPKSEDTPTVELGRISASIPVGLLRDAKGLAAMRGMTLNEYYACAINNFNERMMQLIEAEKRVVKYPSSHPFLNR